MAKKNTNFVEIRIFLAHNFQAQPDFGRTILVKVHFFQLFGI
jgi:hypothetical protein